MPVFEPKGKMFDSLKPEHISQFEDQVRQLYYENKLSWLDANRDLENIDLLKKVNEKINTNKFSNWDRLNQLHPRLKQLGWEGAKEMEYGIENLAVFDPSKLKSIWAKGKGPGLLGGFAAMPNMNPLEDLRKFVDKYREVQGPLADKITEQVSQPFGGADEGLKALGRIGFDPLNIGAVGDVMGAIELLTPEQKKEKLIKTMEKK